MFLTCNQTNQERVIDMLTSSMLHITTTEALYAVISASLVLAASYLYQTETEILRTGALVVLLSSITTACILNYNIYLGVTIFIVEIGAITALTLLQQAYYNSRILNIAPLWLLTAYPMYTQLNVYFSAHETVEQSYFNRAEAASELYKSLLTTTDPYTPTLLAFLTWGSIFIAVLVTTVGNWSELKSVKQIYSDIRTDKLIVFKKVTNETRSKLLRTNVIFC